MSAETRYQTTDSPHARGSEVWENRGINEECPEPALTDPGRPRFDLTERGEASMADLNSTVTTTPGLPESLIDGCPSCVVNVEAPSSVYAISAGHLANYVCLDCGHAWSTSWGV